MSDKEPLRDAALAAFLDANVTVSVAITFYRTGRWFYNRFLCHESQPRYVAVRQLFSLTFTVSLALYTLMLFEIIGLMHPESRRVLWFLVIYITMLLLVLVLPFCQAFYLLLDRGNSRPAAIRGSILSLALFLFILYRIADPFQATSSNKSSSNPLPEFLSIDLAVGRILIVGTAMLAVISGLSAVSVPVEHIAAFLRPVTHTEMAARENTLMSALMLVRDQKEKAILAERTTTTPLDTVVSRSTTVSIGEHRAGSTDLKPPVMRRRIQKAYATLIGELPQDAYTGTDENDPDTAEAERNANNIFLEYNDVAEAWHRRKYSKTPIGFAFVVFGWFMLVFCVARVGTAAYSILAQHKQTDSMSPLSTGLQRLAAVFGLEIDVAAWSQILTFFFTSLIIVINIRGALMRLTQLFTFVSVNSAMSGTAAIFLAQLMGAYFLSSLVLIRARLPAGYRSTTAEALGDIEFNFYRRWFDIIFLVSALAGVFLLLLQNRRPGQPRRNSSTGVLYRTN